MTDHRKGKGRSSHRRREGYQDAWWQRRLASVEKVLAGRTQERVVTLVPLVAGRAEVPQVVVLGLITVGSDELDLFFFFLLVNWGAAIPTQPIDGYVQKSALLADLALVEVLHPSTFELPFVGFGVEQFILAAVHLGLHHVQTVEQALMLIAQLLYALGELSGLRAGLGRGHNRDGGVRHWS